MYALMSPGYEVRDLFFFQTCIEGYSAVFFTFRYMKFSSLDYKLK